MTLADLNALLAGRPLYGSTGFNIENTLAQALSGQGNDLYSQLAPYGLFRNSEGNFDFSSSNPGLDNAGRLNRNGQTYVQLAGTHMGNQGEPINADLVTYDPQYGLITPYSNIKPESNAYGDLVFAAAALGLGLPTAAAALGGTAGTAGGLASTDAAESGGTLGLNAAGTGTTPYAGSSGLLGGAPVVDNSVQAGGLGGAPVVDHSVQAGGLLGSSGTSGTGLLGSLGNYITSNPLRAIGLAQTAYGLLGGHSGQPGSSGTSSKGGSGNGTPINVQQQFYTNPYLAAQIQRGYGGH